MKSHTLLWEKIPQRAKVLWEKIPLSLYITVERQAGRKVTNSRAKGQRGERELCALLGERLGIDLARNLDQCRSGGADIELPRYAIEVKRGERFLSKWIDQAIEQSGSDRVPVLAWRQNRQPWRLIVLSDVDQFCEAVNDGKG